MSSQQMITTILTSGVRIAYKDHCTFRAQERSEEGLGCLCELDRFLLQVSIAHFSDSVVLFRTAV